MNMQIASAAQQQSAVSAEIDRDVHSITQVSEVTAQGAQDAAELSGAVTEEANRLQTLMSKFRV